MRWKCKNCGKTVTTNDGKPVAGPCKKDKNGKMIPHNWEKQK